MVATSTGDDDSVASVQLCIDSPSSCKGGAVYVFKRADSTQPFTGPADQKLFITGAAGTAGTGDVFGEGLGLSGNTIAIGAPNADAIPSGDTNNGALFIYTRPDEASDFTFLQRIQPDNTARNYFGQQVDIDGDYVLCGSPDSTHDNSYGGKAFIFYRSSPSGTFAPTPQAELDPGVTLASSDRFGRYVSLSGDYAAVASTNKDDPVTPLADAGAVFIFERSGTAWPHKATFYGDTTSAFGYDLDINGNILAVSEKNTASGVHVFERDATSGIWTQTTVIPCPDGVCTQMGQGVAVDGNTIITLGTNTWPDAKVMVFEKSGNDWNYAGNIPKSLSSGSTGQFGRLGLTMDLSVNTIIVGDYQHAGSSSISFHGAVNTVILTPTTYENCATDVQEPPVPTYSIGLDGTSMVLNVTFQQDRAQTISNGYGNAFKVVFDDSTTSVCDLDTTGLTEDDASYGSYWSRVGYSVSACTEDWQMVVPINVALGDCGYTQDNAREPGRTHFLNTIKLNTNQTRNDLRDVYYATREFPFTSDISIATNTTATVTGLQVFGTAYTLNLLGDLKVTVTDNFGNNPSIPYVYTVSGTVVTSVQWPYRLELSEDSAHEHFNSQDFTAVANTYCDAEADNNTACTQEWDFSFNIETDVACVENTGIESLTNEWVWMKFIVNCSAQFTGECAPDFAVDPAMNLTLASANFCPKKSTISLETFTNTYAFQPAGEDNTAVPNGDGEEWLTESTSAVVTTTTQTIFGSYVEEAIFTYESTLYGEVRVGVADGAATLATTNITQIRTVPSDTNTYSTRVVYDADVTGTIESSKSDASVKTANTGFGSTAAYEKNRARFQFQLNNNTFDRNNAAHESADAAEGGSIEIDLIVTFSEGANSIDDEWASAVLLQQFVVDNNGKSVPIRASVPAADLDSVSLYEDSGTFTASANFQLGSNIAPPTVTGQNASSASNALTIGAVAVAGVAVIALVAAVVMRRPQPTKPANDLNALPQSSSFAVPAPVQSHIQMQTLATNYGQTGFTNQV
jgi:FG-GAP repeat